MGKQARARKARQASIGVRAGQTDKLASHWKVGRDVAAELATVATRTNGVQVPRDGRMGGRGEAKIADEITGREYRVRVNAAIVDGVVKTKTPARPKASVYVPKGRTGAAQTNRLLADWSDPDLKETRGSGVAHSQVYIDRCTPFQVRVDALKR